MAQSHNTSESESFIITRIITSYQFAVTYFKRNKFNAAKKKFIEVLKPIMSKPHIRSLHQNNICFIKTEILDSIYHIGLIYLNDLHFIEATAILQYCANFCTKYEISDPHFFLSKAYSIEKYFLESVGVFVLDDRSNLSDQYNIYRTELKNIRYQTAQQLNDIGNIRERSTLIEALYGKCMNLFINNHNNGLIQKIFIDCFNQIKNNNDLCDYSIIALGSFARGTATPWSDIEYAILVIDNHDKYKQFFRSLTTLFHIKIINLGEGFLRSCGIEAFNNFKTGLDLDDWFWDDVTRNGLSIDGAIFFACKTPLGRQNYQALIQQTIVSMPNYELIATPSSMAKFQQEQCWSETDPNLVQVLRSVKLIYGSQSLLDEYRTIIRNTVSLDIVRERTVKILTKDIEIYQLRLGGDVDRKLINVKYDLYRLIDRIINGLENYFDINVNSENKHSNVTSWNILDCFDNNNLLREALSIATELRLKTCIDITKDLMQISATDIDTIQHFYRIMLPVQELVKKFCESYPKFCGYDPNTFTIKTLFKNESLYVCNTETINLINARLDIYNNNSLS